jgi:hypothetical protein
MSERQISFDYEVISRTFWAASLDCVSGSLISRRLDGVLSIGGFEIADHAPGVASCRHAV